jgi:hypothetical protein
LSLAWSTCRTSVLFCFLLGAFPHVPQGQKKTPGRGLPCCFRPYIAPVMISHDICRNLQEATRAPRMAPFLLDESGYHRFYYNPVLQIFVRGLVKTLVAVALAALSVIAQNRCDCPDSWICVGPAIPVFFSTSVRSHYDPVPKAELADYCPTSKVAFHLLFSSYRIGRMLVRPSLDPLTRSRDFYSGCHAMPAPMCYCETAFNLAGTLFWVVVCSWQGVRACLPTAFPPCLAILFATQT